MKTFITARLEEDELTVRVGTVTDEDGKSSSVINDVEPTEALQKALASILKRETEKKEIRK